MPKSNPICNRCGVELNDENWYGSGRKSRNYICKECGNERHRRWRKANPDKYKASYTRADRKQGARPYNENKECSSYLGCHIAERVLSHVFKNVEKMPYGNPGFDFICNQGKLIDVKGACLSGKYPSWGFGINRNIIADYFLCLAFDDMENLNPLHIWLLPGSVVNHLKHASITPSTIHKWDEYALDTSKISECCVTMKEN